MREQPALAVGDAGLCRCGAAADMQGAALGADVPNPCVMPRMKLSLNSSVV